MNVSTELGRSAEYISTCPECNGRFYHSMRTALTIPEETKVSLNMLVVDDLEVQSQIWVGVPNDSQIRQYSAPSQYSIMELTQARVRGNRSKDCVIRHGIASKKAKRRAVYERLYRAIVDDTNKSIGSTGHARLMDSIHCPAFPRDAEWDDTVRAYVSRSGEIENDEYIHRTKYAGGICTMASAISTYRNGYSCEPCQEEYYCGHTEDCQNDCEYENCAFRLHSIHSNVPENIIDGQGPMEYYCKINGAKGTAFLDTGVLNLPVNLDARTSSAFVSEDYVKRCCLKTITLHNKPQFDRPAKFNITVANEDAMSCHKMVKGVKLRMGKHKEPMDLFVIPSNQFDIVLGRQWLKLRRPRIDYDDDSLHFGTITEDGNPREVIVPAAGMHRRSSFHYSSVDDEGASKVRYDSDSNDTHFSFQHFWHEYTHSREYLVDKSPVKMLRISANVLGEMMNIPGSAEDADDQFDPPEDVFLGNSTDKFMTSPNMGKDCTDQSIPGWQHKGTIENMNHPLTERPCKSDVDSIMWDEFGDDGQNRFPQEIPDIDNTTNPTIKSVIPILPGHENDHPCRQARKLNKLEQDELLTQLQYYLKKGWIRPSSSPYGACILFVRKKNGKFRMCIDYRGLNKITRKDKYPLPDAESVIEQMQGAKFFSQLDLAHGYHQCILPPEDIEKTTFRTMFGAYEWKVLTFGFSNAVPAFVRLMNNTLHGLLGKCCMVFVDDVVIYSKTKEQHVLDCRAVMQAITDAGLYVNWTKSQFDVESIEYLGLYISRDGITPIESKIEAVSKMERPTTLYHLRAFLGAAGYYRKFIYNFAKIAKPLTDLTKQNDAREKTIATNTTITKWGRKQTTELIGKHEWTDDCEAAFHNLKHALCSYPVLKLPDPALPYEIMVDASGMASGAVLMQRDETGALHPVAFYSAKHNDAESSYPVHEFELLAIFKCLKQWRHLLIGSKISLYTDHKPLTHLKDQDKLSPRQERWITFLADYDVDIFAVSGTSNKVADCLSRYNYDGLTELADGIKKQFIGTVHSHYMDTALMYSLLGYDVISQLQPSTVTHVVNDSVVAESPAPISGGVPRLFLL